MKKILVASLLIAFAFACKNAPKKEAEDSTVSSADEVKTTELVFQWTTDTLLTTSESVIYDKVRDVLYVSNIAGVPSERDGVGFISKVGMDGTIIEAEWISGMDAPKGLGLHGDKLYVNDIDKIIEIDIPEAKVAKSHPIEGAIFLNDITTDSDGNVYASDSNAGAIFMLEGDKVSKVTDGLSGPNGLLHDGETFYVALWNEQTLNTLDLDSKAITKVADGLENPDGIEPVGDGTYFVSSWQGLIHLVDAEGNGEILLDTSEDEIGAADIEYIQEKNLLLVPTFNKNGLSAYTFVR